MAHQLTDTEKRAVLMLFDKQCEVWQKRGFPRAYGKYENNFFNEELRPLRGVLEQYLRDRKVPPPGNPDVIPVLLVMSSQKIGFQRQYDLYGFKRYLSYINLGDVKNTEDPYTEPYALVNVTPGKIWSGFSPAVAEVLIATNGGFNCNFEEGLAAMKFIDENWKAYHWNYEVMLCGARHKGIFVPYIDFANASGPVIKSSPIDAASSCRGPLSYEDIIKF